MKKSSIAGFAAAATAAAFFAGSFMQQRPAEPATAAAAPNLFPFIRSFEGTVPDGQAREAAEDSLVVSDELVRLFEYYLVAVGERPLDDLRRDIERALDERLKPRAAQEAKALLGRYLAYKQALVEVEKNAQLAGNGIEAIRGRLHAIQETRQKFFSNVEAQAMFGMEDAMNLDALARLEISQDKTLNDAQKAERLAALDRALPAPLREARDSAMQVVRLEETATNMRGKGASEDDIYRMRAAALSPEAAARMADVDREDAEWKRRIQAYLAERQRLLEGGAARSPEDRTLAVQQLRQAHFSEDEQRRLPAYE